MFEIVVGEYSGIPCPFRDGTGLSEYCSLLKAYGPKGGCYRVRCMGCVQYLASGLRPKDTIPSFCPLKKEVAIVRMALTQQPWPTYCIAKKDVPKHFLF